VQDPRDQGQQEPTPVDGANDCHTGCGESGREADGAASSFAADRVAEVWSFGEPVRSGESVSGTINRFSPRDVPPDVWGRIEPVVKESVTKVGFTDAQLAKKCLSVVAQLAVWADRIGQPVDTASLFTPEFIDRFAVEGCAHLSDGSRRNYRSQLWKVGGAVVGHKLFPPRSVPLRISDLTAPYSTAEIAELVSWSRGLPTESMRRDAWALVVLGLGAGLNSEEISRAVGTDVHEADGIVLVDVLAAGGRIARVVPVHRLWAAEVLGVARDSGERPYFRPDRTRILRGDILGFIRRCDTTGPPKFTPQRLRITWIVGHLSAGTHLAVLQEASGVAAVQLAKYLTFATPPETAQARRLLAGTG
jgi:hypothetical protein